MYISRQWNTCFMFWNLNYQWLPLVHHYNSSNFSCVCKNYVGDNQYTETQCDMLSLQEARTYFLFSNSIWRRADCKAWHPFRPKDQSIIIFVHATSIFSLVVGTSILCLFFLYMNIGAGTKSTLHFKRNRQTNTRCYCCRMHLFETISVSRLP
jgi:hypothetical protein